MVSSCFESHTHCLRVIRSVCEKQRDTQTRSAILFSYFTISKGISAEHAWTYCWPWRQGPCQNVTLVVQWKFTRGCKLTRIWSVSASAGAGTQINSRDTTFTAGQTISGLSAAEIVCNGWRVYMAWSYDPIPSLQPYTFTQAGWADFVVHMNYLCFEWQVLAGVSISDQAHGQM